MPNFKDARGNPVPQGSIERIDPPNPKDRQAEPPFDIIVQIDAEGRRQQRYVFVYKEGEDAWLAIQGGGDDTVWWTPLPTLKNFNFRDLRTQTVATPRANGQVLSVAFHGHFINVGTKMEWRSVITDFVMVPTQYIKP